MGKRRNDGQSRQNLSQTVFCGMKKYGKATTRIFGVWPSLVRRLLWEQEITGSNPVTPTILSFLPISKEPIEGFDVVPA